MTPTPVTCPDCRCTFTPATASPRDGCFCPRCLRRQKRAQLRARIGRAVGNVWFDLRHPGWSKAVA